MNVLFAFVLLVNNWYYVPVESKSESVEIESIDLNLKENEFAITFFALSDGEATLLHGSNGENILINVGGSGAIDELKKLFQLYDIHSLDRIIVTKKEFMNMKNLSWLFEQYSVKEVIVGKNSINHSFHDMKTTKWSEGSINTLGTNMNAAVLYDGDGRSEGMDMLLSFAHQKVLILSSSSMKAYQKLLESDVSNIQIVKVVNQVSEDALFSQLLKKADPHMAYMFQSKKAKTSSRTMQLLYDHWIDVYHAQNQGTVTVKFSNDNYEIITISGEQ